MVDLERRATEALRRVQERQRPLIEELARVAGLRGWKVYRAPTVEEALDHLRSLSTALGARAAVRSSQEVFRQVAVDAALAGAGVRVTVMARDGGAAPDRARQEAAQADVGITGADYAIAETGTVVLLPRRGVSRLVSLLPPVHVALVRPAEVLESLDDLFLLRRWAYYQGKGDMGSSMNFITGPSRTADIEQTLVVGAHGPKETHMIILG